MKRSPAAHRLATRKQRTERAMRRQLRRWPLRIVMPHVSPAELAAQMERWKRSPQIYFHTEGGS